MVTLLPEDVRMLKTISRRQALAAGTASSGLVFGSPSGKADAKPLPDVWGEDFMMQWSPPYHVERDLTPGKKHVRLSCAGHRLKKPETMGFPEKIKAIRDAGYTAGCKVDLAFEAVNSCNNNTPKSHVRLKQDVGDDRVKVTLDPANMLHGGVFYRTTELINECFDRLGEDILYAHCPILSGAKILISPL